MNLVNKFEQLEKKFYSLNKKQQWQVLESMDVDDFEYIRNYFDNQPAQTIKNLEDAIKKLSPKYFNY